MFHFQTRAWARAAAIGGLVAAVLTACGTEPEPVDDIRQGADGGALRGDGSADGAVTPRRDGGNSGAPSDATVDGSGEAAAPGDAGMTDAGSGDDGASPGDDGASADEGSGDVPDADTGDAAAADEGPTGDAGASGLDASTDDGASADDGASDALPGDDGAPATEPDGACIPATGCPSTYHCGRWVNPCSGQTFLCGSACSGGNVCLANATSPPSQTCQPKACSGKCGTVGTDSCGVGVTCPACAAGQQCVNNACVPQTDAGTSSNCAQLTCTPDTHTTLCGGVTDGCGHTLACSCPTGQTCVGGVCQAPPPECENGSLCGSVQNACGSGNVSCAQCSGASSCTKNVCTSCTPPSCNGATCGNVSNGCGPAINCGTCASGSTCFQGSCCVAQTCGQALDAGAVTGCSAVNLGCGVQKSCAPCGTGTVCTSGACVACTPKTCADFGNDGCGHSDGCGHTLNCCGNGTSCQGTLCCGAGQVNFGGGCCTPACDPSLETATQTSCGQVIFCGKN